ncbi:MAG: ATP-binding protein [Planctomycetota bacterium]|jgi:anti-sigma regulatory factor (Ser/Thr protein kinase)
MYALEIINTSRKGKQLKVKPDRELRIGNVEGCKIRIKHPDMHDNHARFRLVDNALEVEALDDGAHVFVNSQDVMRSELRHDDIVRVGPLRFRVIDDREGTQMFTRTKSRLEDLLAEAEQRPEEVDDTLFDFAKEDLFFLTGKRPELRRHLNFSIPSRDRFIEQAQQFIARLVKQTSMDEFKVEAFMTCTKELILNAHRHGHEYDEKKVITLRYRDLGDALSLSIEDQGTGFDHQTAVEAVAGKDAAAAARERYKAGGFGGLGFQMIVRMADKLEYNDPGNIVTFTVSKQM